MVDFAAVSLRILSPDGKTVLGELKQIDAAGQRAATNAGNIGANMRKSVSAARTLAFAAGGVTQGLTGAVGAAGNLAESIAATSRNARVAAGAGAIGAIVTVGLAVGLAWKKGKEQLEGFLAKQKELASQTKIAELTGIGPGSDIAAKREAIVMAGDRELQQIREMKLEEWQRNQLLKERQKLTQEQLHALDRELDRTRNKAFEAAARSISVKLEESERGRPSGIRDPLKDAEFLGMERIRSQRALALADLAREAQENDFTESQVASLTKGINKTFDNETEALKASLADQANEVGQVFVESLAGSISDGIAAAISSGNIGDGFRALTGGILMGLGEMVQEIGTKSLLAAKLMSSIVAALRRFAPAGAIGPSLALIALGGVLKGLGAAMGGGGGGGSFSGGGGGGFGGGSSGTIIDRGLINPLNPAPNTAGLQAQPVVQVGNLVLLSPKDPTWQRQLLESIDFAESRRSG